MPLSFKKLKPVDFEDFQATPQVDTELKLRIQNLKFSTEEQLKQAKDLLAKAFPDHETQVRQFMDDNQMGAISLQELQAYILGGEEMLAQYLKQVDKALDKTIEKALGE